jgi:hypothetical protein
VCHPHARANWQKAIGGRILGVNQQGDFPATFDVSASDADELQAGLTLRVRAGESMAFTLESERILREAVAGIPRVARTIAEIPAALRERALEAVARSYQQRLRELGHAEADAQIWISAVMLRLRSQITEQRKKMVVPGISLEYANALGRIHDDQR